MWKLSLQRQTGSVIASGFVAAIIYALCWLALTVVVPAQSTDVSQPGRHFILLIDDSGSISASHRGEMANSSPNLLFGGIRATAQGGKALEKLEPGRDRGSIVFYTIYDYSPGRQGTRQGRSVRPQDMFLLEESWKPVSREEFNNKLGNWLSRPCRSGGQWSPISISEMLVLPYLQERLLRDELHSQTILVVATDGKHNGKTAITDKDQLSIGQPTSDRLNDLPGPLDQALMLSSSLSMVAFRLAQSRQERQSPDRFGPRDLDQQHATEPTQAAGFDKVRMGRSHRVAVDTFGFDLIAAPPLNRIVEAQDQFASRGEGRNQQSQQDSAGFQGRPSRTVQDSMVVSEASFLAQTLDTQAGSHSSFTRRQDRCDQQEVELRLCRTAHT